MAPDSDSGPILQGIEPTLIPLSSTHKRPSPNPRFLRNTWYVAMFSPELGEGELKHRTIMNEPIVLYRKENGGIAAIADRCAHRHVPLSMGRLQAGDRIQCIYHGLEFGADGKCALNPHGSGKASDALKVKSYTVIEKHTLIWVWMGDKPADESKIPDYGCLDDRDPLHITDPGYLMVNANYQLLVDNLLDLSHISFTHAGILGNADTATAEPLVEQDGDVITVSRNSKDAETPGILKMMAVDDELKQRGDQWQAISWFPASNLWLEFGVSKVGEPKETGTGYLALHFLTPETEKTTHYHYTAARWGVQTDDATNKEIRELIYKMRTFAFADQDVPVIEAQQVSMDQGGEDLAPTLLSVDTGPLQYQKVLDRLIADEN
ncbi:MAG: aromatic ring-hydroxylating dioxygenase subunit alpha [Alphaproteobacteria bacterium]|jgi:phenylpropionate dioxygenase-like ring-hydroxylating dioxygenase large terminal subunit|nr:aromatic ring-hydroxylating dioxygenase subunit alpha [Alphaproteobacteria bacterium]